MPRLSQSKINLIAYEVRDGKAIPREAKRLMVEFCRYDAQDRKVPSPEFRRLIHHFAACFTNYLTRHRSIKGAMGLQRAGPGNPGLDVETERQTALEVLRLYLKGSSVHEAVAQVVQKLPRGERQVRNAWRNHKGDALDLLRRGRTDTHPWSDTEKARLRRIFRSNKSV